VLMQHPMGPETHPGGVSQQAPMLRQLARQAKCYKNHLPRYNKNGILLYGLVCPNVECNKLHDFSEANLLSRGLTLDQIQWDPIKTNVVDNDWGDCPSGFKSLSAYKKNVIWPLSKGASMPSSQTLTVWA